MALKYIDITQQIGTNLYPNYALNYTMENQLDYNILVFLRVNLLITLRLPFIGKFKRII